MLSMLSLLKVRALQRRHGQEAVRRGDGISSNGSRQACTRGCGRGGGGLLLGLVAACALHLRGGGGGESGKRGHAEGATDRPQQKGLFGRIVPLDEHLCVGM